MGEKTETVAGVVIVVVIALVALTALDIGKRLILGPSITVTIDPCNLPKATPDV